MPYSVWQTSNATNSDGLPERFAVLLSEDETTAFTFTTGAAHGESLATNCRMDVFSINDLTQAVFSKGERTIEKRHCRFPAIHAFPETYSYVITVATEYYGEDAGRFGFMRIELGSDYYELQIEDEEKIFFTEYYETRFMSVYFPSAWRMYAMTRRSGNEKNFLLMFDWESGITRWQLKGLSEDPNAIEGYLGNTSLRSIIYAEVPEFANQD